MVSLSDRLTFPDPEALWALDHKVAVFDQSGAGRLGVTGAGSLEFLHNQSTNDLKGLDIGQGCETVFITPTAGILDLVEVYRTGDDQALIWTAPQRHRVIESTLSRFIAFLPGVELRPITEGSVAFRLMGPAVPELLGYLGWPELAFSDPWRYHTVIWQGSPVQVMVGFAGTTLIAAADVGDPLWEQLLGWGAIPASEEVWQQWCLSQGRPLPDQELTEAVNPLEAGLWQAVSLTKGCYVGQEVLAKQVTYQRIRQTLWGIQLTVPAAAGTPVLREGDKIGSITRSSLWGETALGLAFIRSKANPYAGLEVEVDQRPAHLIQLPYLSYPPGVGQDPGLPSV